MPAQSSSVQTSQPTPNNPAQPPHLAWLVDTGEKVNSKTGLPISIWELKHQPDEQVLSAWAAHFRDQYCPDSLIDALREGYGFSRGDYLNQIKFPDLTLSPGPSIRAGDFTEILVTDYLEFCLGYWIARTRFSDKTVRNESKKGCDVIGFKLVQAGGDPRLDALALFEAKAGLTGTGLCKRLQDAIDDSAKDPRRKAESLNAIKQRFLDQNRSEEAKIVTRFQNPVDRPYTEVQGAVALLSTDGLDKENLPALDASSHPAAANLSLLIIHGAQLMPLVHGLYKRAADEA
jgi:hypothetical protein